MSTPKYVFYLIYFIFHVLLLAGSIIVINNVSNANSSFEWISDFVNDENWFLNRSYVVPFTVFGLILFLINIVMVNIQISGHKKKENKLETEVNSLKAKLYDLQGIEPRKTPPVKNTGTTDTPEDKSGENP